MQSAEGNIRHCTVPALKPHLLDELLDTVPYTFTATLAILPFEATNSLNAGHPTPQTTTAVFTPKQGRISSFLFRFKDQIRHLSNEFSWHCPKSEQNEDHQDEGDDSDDDRPFEVSPDHVTEGFPRRCEPKERRFRSAERHTSLSVVPFLVTHFGSSNG